MPLPKIFAAAAEMKIRPVARGSIALRDISAVNGVYSLINISLYQFEWKKGYKKDLHFNLK